MDNGMRLEKSPSPTIDNISSRKEPAQVNSRRTLDKSLAGFDAHGFETETIEFREMEGESRAVRRVVLHDVPNQMFVSVEEESENRFIVRRTVTKSRSKHAK